MEVEQKRFLELQRAEAQQLKIYVMRGPPVIVIIERLCALEKKATTWLLSATTRIEVCKCVQTVHIEKRPKNYALVLRSMTIKCIMFKKIMRFCHKPRYAPKNIKNFSCKSFSCNFLIFLDHLKPLSI